jgi:hypothetical protein
MALASYIIGSGLTALIGGISYNYLFIKEEKLLENKDLNESINYSLIDEKLNDNLVCSKETPKLGITFKDKSNSIIKICKEECGFEFINNSKKDRQKLLRYIREYEKIGKLGFVNNHKKKYKRKQELLNINLKIK